MSGPDHSFSIDPSGLKKLMSEIRLIEKIKGDGMKIPRNNELEGRFYIRTSITAKCDLKKDDILTNEVLSVKRPADGIEPKYLDQLIGKKLNKDLSSDSPITWKDII